MAITEHAVIGLPAVVGFDDVEHAVALERTGRG
jgi:hypothetical protein